MQIKNLLRRFQAFLFSIPFLLALPAYAENVNLALIQAIELAKQNNPTLISYREKLNASGYQIGVAKSGYYPQASVSADYRRATANSAGQASSALPAGTDSSLTGKHESFDSYNSFATSLNLSQTIYDFGRTGGQYDSAKALQNSAEDDLKSATDNVYFTVVQTYFSVLAAQEALTSAKETEAQMQKHLELAQTQVTAGLRQKIDVLRAQSDLSSAKLALVQAGNGLALARKNLVNAMGVRNNAEYWVQPPERPLAIPELGGDDAVQMALKKRADYKSLVNKIRATEGTVTSARSGYYPTPAVNGSLSYSGNEVQNMIYNWYAGISLTWNFFSGFNTTNSVNEASANLNALQAELKSLELTVKNDVESAWLGVTEAREKLDPSAALLASAQQTLLLAEERYAAGVGNIIEVADAQSVYSQAKMQKIQADYDLQVSYAKYLKAIGEITSIQGGSGI